MKIKVKKGKGQRRVENKQIEDRHESLHDKDG